LDFLVVAELEEQEMQLETAEQAEQGDSMVVEEAAVDAVGGIQELAVKHIPLVQVAQEPTESS
jgi:hypothetical protein